jgi:hypothetical protein
MIRNGHESASFFLAKEAEHTPALGMDTLFVVGIQSVDDIENTLKSIKTEVRHIFFGANDSFHPVSGDRWDQWEKMIQHFLDQGYLCSLDIGLRYVEEFNDGGLNDHNNFIPIIKVPLPYIKLWNYNTCIKIDDRDFNSTNPGVWVHDLHDLKSRSNFTDWRDYQKDEVLK